MDEDLGRIAYRILCGCRLTRAEFHLFIALHPEILNFTNKFLGLSDFDDYEVFDHCCYEGENKSGYIDPDRHPDPPLQGTERILKARYPGPTMAPEDIFWNRLRPEQQSFFEHHLPKVAIRFKRDGG
jgi:hypothetical protein